MLWSTKEVLLKFSKRTDSAQLTVTVGLNDILKSNQADYIMHQNMVKWYSFAAKNIWSSPEEIRFNCQDIGKKKKIKTAMEESFSSAVSGL